ncbi:hypothetical protein PG984_016413 [Apiospora sp. TS-2023a]
MDTHSSESAGHIAGQSQQQHSSASNVDTQYSIELGPSSVGRSLVFGWDRQRAAEESRKHNEHAVSRKPSYMIRHVLVRISRPGDPTDTNCMSISFCFPKDTVGTSSGALNSRADPMLEVDFLFEAPNYDIVYVGPLDLDKLPVGIKMGAAGKEFSVFKVQVLNGVKPAIQLPSEQASMVAAFYVPILERQEHFLVAVDNRNRGRVMQWSRNAAMDPSLRVLEELEASEHPSTNVYELVTERGRQTIAVLRGKGIAIASVNAQPSSPADAFRPTPENLRHH